MSFNNTISLLETSLEHHLEALQESHNEELQSAIDQIVALRESNESLQERIEELLTENADLSTERDRFEEELDDVREELESAEDNNSEMLSELRSALADSATIIDQQNDRIRELMAELGGE